MRNKRLPLLWSNASVVGEDLIRFKWRSDSTAAGMNFFKDPKGVRILLFWQFFFGGVDWFLPKEIKLVNQGPHLFFLEP